MTVQSSHNWGFRNLIRTCAMVRLCSYTLKRSVGLPYTNLKDASVRSLTLCDGGEVPAITPFFWEKHLPRIHGAARHSAEYVIKHDLNRKTFGFRPVIAHWLKDASLIGGSVFSGRFRHELLPVGQKFISDFSLTGPVAEIKEAALVSTCAGATWWGHWIEDEVPLQMLAEKYPNPVVYDRDFYRDEKDYSHAFGLNEPERYRVALFEELLIINDFAQNPDKTARYQELRKRMAILPQGHDRIFLSRGNSGVRRVLVNEEEVCLKLESIGFKTIDVTSSSAEEVIAACRGANVVVSVEGSHLAPLLYLVDDFATLIILNPPFQVHTTVADIGVFCGLSAGMFICEPDGESMVDFRADPEELTHFIEDAVEYGFSNRSTLDSFLDRVISMANL